MWSEVRESLFTKNEKSKLNIVVNVLIIIIFAALIFELLFSATYSGVYIVGDSMNPTLTGAYENSYGVADTSGDYVYVNRSVTPDYGDIVVINKTKDITIVKRVIAKGGDYVKIVGGKVYIRHSADEPFGDPLSEEYVSPENNHANKKENTFHNDGVGYPVPEGCYFVLGDNRDVSLDSRENDGTSFTDEQIFGVVTEWSLKNKKFYTALHKYFSFDLPSYFGIDNRVKRNMVS